MYAQASVGCNILYGWLLRSDMCWCVKRSHVGAAGMRSELTFERGGTVDIARVKSGEANVFAEGRSRLHSPHL